jgi:WD40 repeat protein
MRSCISLSSILFITQGCLPISNVQPVKIEPLIQVSPQTSRNLERTVPLNGKETDCSIRVDSKSRPLRLVGMKGYPAITFSADSNSLAATDGSGGDGMIIWNLSNMKNVQIAPSHWLGQIAFSPDNKYSAFSSAQGSVYLRNLDDRIIIQLISHRKSVNGISFHPNSQYVATSAADNTTRIWDLKGENIFTLAGQRADQIGTIVSTNKWMSGVNWSPTGKFLMSNSGNSTKIWKFLSQDIITLEGHQGRINSSAFSPDETKVVTASDDGTAKVWDISGKTILTLDGHKKSIVKVIFSPNGSTILTVSADKTMRLWNLNGQTLAVLKGHEEAVANAVFSNNGKCIFSSSIDGTIRLWNLSGKEISKLPGSFTLAISPNNRYLATEENSTVFVWKLRELQ